jgi:hypothetical protein
MKELGHTSPSHLFFPFLQAVQARAPRLGMWACCWDMAPEDMARSWSVGEGWEGMVPLKRRFLEEAKSTGPLREVVDEWDIGLLWCIDRLG